MSRGRWCFCLLPTERAWWLNNLVVARWCIGWWVLRVRCVLVLLLVLIEELGGLSEVLWRL
ncbi:MAG: hypothetical protein RXN78_03860 [Vulcanisaeta sp.]